MISERDTLILQLRTAQELLRRRAKERFATFVHFMKPDYSMQWFHAYVCEKLQAFAEGRIKKLMILMPPQHGKSELATRLLTPFLLGRNPDKKIAIASYNATIAHKFNRAIQLYIDNPRYHELYPRTLLNGSRLFGTKFDNAVRNMDEIDIIKEVNDPMNPGNTVREKGGKILTVGRGGALTSETVDVGIIDDLYKDRVEATSETISQTTWDWYVDVFSTRLHNDSQQLIMNTRWDEFDLCGRLIVEEPGEWEIIKFAAIRTKDEIPYDPRKEGEALWPGKHSLGKILGIKQLNEVTFNSLYQQDPKPNTQLLVFTDWIEVPKWPAKKISQISWGLDFGKTIGINALVKCGFNGDEVYFHECCYESGLSAANIVEILKANGYHSDQVVYCDHMNDKIAALRSLGISAFPALKGEGSIISGIDKLHSMKCHYTAQSLNIKKELGKYQYITYGNIITRTPVDEWNHAMDACRYGTYTPHNFR